MEILKIFNKNTANGERRGPGGPPTPYRIREFINQSFSLRVVSFNYKKKKNEFPFYPKTI